MSREIRRIPQERFADNAVRIGYYEDNSTFPRFNIRIDSDPVLNCQIASIAGAEYMNSFANRISDKEMLELFGYFYLYSNKNIIMMDVSNTVREWFIYAIFKNKKFTEFNKHASILSNFSYRSTNDSARNIMLINVSKFSGSQVVSDIYNKERNLELKRSNEKRKEEKIKLQVKKSKEKSNFIEFLTKYI